MRLTKPGAVMAAAVLAGALAATSCRPPVRGNGWNVLLVTFETTRADHLGAYGYERDTSPRIDALAAEGVLFERVSTVSPRTNPSLASMLTSTYPHHHGVRNLLLPLEPSSRTLAEVFRDAGYLTGAVQTHPRLIAASGFAQGFDRYEDATADHPLAPQSCGKAAEWIRKHADADRPWFLWLHVMDPHWTYDPPEGWRTPFGPDDPRPGRLYREIAERRASIGEVIFRNSMPPDEVGAFVDFYDAEIRYSDHAFGVLLDVLDELGIRDRTVVALTADHGESLGEHDYFFEHGDFGTEPEIHVPLVLAAPERARGGLRVPWTADTVDLAPTLLDLVGLPPEETFLGRSLATLFEGNPSGHRPAFGETGKRFHDQNERRDVDGVAGKWRWVRQGEYKLVHRPAADGSAARSLYRLDEDPDEARDVSERYPDAVRELGAALDEWLSDDPGVARDYHITPEIREELRSLGYID